MSFSKKQWLEVFSTNLLLNLKAETKKTYLSYAWWVLEPAMFVLVFYVVFAVFLNRGTEDFLVFLLLGKIPFLWFSKSVSNSANSICDGRGLIGQLPIPKGFFPLLVVAQDGVKQSVVFAFLFTFFLLIEMNPSLVWLNVILVILTQLFLVIAFSLVSAAITPYLPDFKFIIATLMMLLMFGSGIFYSYKEVLLPEHQKLFLLNPLATLIKNYREVIIDHSPPDFHALGLIFASSILIITSMLIWFKIKDTHYARLVIQ